MAETWHAGPHPPIQTRLWLPLARILTWPVLAILGPIRVHDADRVPVTGPVLILCNHRSDFDPILVQYATRRPLFYMAKLELFTMRVLGPLMRQFGAFPVRRGEPDRKAIRHAAALLDEGQAVVVFPEGQLTRTGELQDLKAGVALVVKLCPGIPVICLGINGSEHVLPYGKVIPRPARRKVHMRWGKSRSFSKDASAAAILGWAENELRRLGGYAEAEGPAQMSSGSR